jgi:predicted RNase H-like nuclease (RuvC/YqgF family)
MGFSISLIKDLEQDLEGRGINIQKYLREIDDVIEDKMAYEKKVEDLKKEAKSLENQIRSMRNEIKEYFKKVKPKMK